MRIVGGRLKSRKLFVSPKTKLRPTADRVKESIFNMLEGELKDKEVLDLFAGTGNLGIEAISRGAKRVIFVDSSPQSVKVIKKNLEDLNCLGYAEILKSDYKKAIGKLAQQGKKIDIIFADPPYLKNYPQKIIDCLIREEILNHNALIIIERHKKEGLDLDSSGLIELKQKRFGDTLVSILFKRG